MHIRITCTLDHHDRRSGAILICSRGRGAHRLGDSAMRQVYGVCHYHLMICDALGLEHAWYAVVDSA